ncbi:hypothetical protein ACJMK2_025715 [Sinanodonta woodiana]|uniref:Uncharacterized protein n=1 Tax=Sinanodonta woodiana TaxID=1069815 RepID=A0ABD3XKU5_SINWO
MHQIVQNQTEQYPQSSIKVKLHNGKIRTAQRLPRGHDKLVVKRVEYRNLGARMRLRDKYYNRRLINFDDPQRLINDLISNGTPYIVIENDEEISIIKNPNPDNNKTSVKIITHDINYTTIEAISLEQLQQLRDEIQSENQDETISSSS